MRRTGSVLRDRFHSRVHKTPREIKNALAYVLCNARKHMIGRSFPGNWVDPCSSAIAFDGWATSVVTTQGAAAPPPLAAPRSWMLRAGWSQKHGPLMPSFVPGS
jgi:hypothetical protein